MFTLPGLHLAWLRPHGAVGVLVCFLRQFVPSCPTLPSVRRVWLVVDWQAWLTVAGAWLVILIDIRSSSAARRHCCQIHSTIDGPVVGRTMTAPRQHSQGAASSKRPPACTAADPLHCGPALMGWPPRVAVVVCAAHGGYNPACPVGLGYWAARNEARIPSYRSSPLSNSVLLFVVGHARRCRHVSSVALSWSSCLVSHDCVNLGRCALWSGTCWRQTRRRPNWEERRGVVVVVLRRRRRGRTGSTRPAGTLYSGIPSSHCKCRVSSSRRPTSSCQYSDAQQAVFTDTLPVACRLVVCVCERILPTVRNGSA